MCKCAFFQLIIFVQLGLSTIWKLFVLPFNPIIHTSSILIVAEIKSGKEKSTLLQGFWTDTQIFDWKIKMQKFKILINLLQTQNSYNNLKINKNAREELRREWGKDFFFWIFLRKAINLANYPNFYLILIIKKYLS